MSRKSRRVRTPKALGEALKQTLFFFLRCLEMAENVFHKNYRRIHDDPKVHRTEGKQICAFAENDEKNDGEEQRKRDIDANDNRAAKITQENPLDEEDQHASKDQIM